MRVHFVRTKCVCSTVPGSWKKDLDAIINCFILAIYTNAQEKETSRLHGNTSTITRNRTLIFVGILCDKLKNN